MNEETDKSNGGFCVKCGNKLEDGQDFCPKCGNKVGPISYVDHQIPDSINLKQCKYCKQTVAKNAKVCPYCRKKIKGSFWNKLSIVIVVIAVIAVLGMLTDTGDLKIINDVGKYNEYGFVEYQGDLVNKGEIDLTNITIKYICYNKNRQESGTLETNIVYIKAGETLHFEINGIVRNPEGLTCSSKIERHLK